MGAHKACTSSLYIMTFPRLRNSSTYPWLVDTSPIRIAITQSATRQKKRKYLYTWKYLISIFRPSLDSSTQMIFQCKNIFIWINQFQGIKLEPYLGSFCSPVLRTSKQIRISSDSCLINHENQIPYHTKCVSFKII